MSTRATERKAVRNAGFTLIEVLLVVVIIGILVGVVAPRLGKRVGQAQVSAARASISAIALAIDMYEVDNGVYPASLQNLIQRGSEMNWRGPYLKDKDSKNGQVPNDPWGTQFGYAVKDDSYEIRSAGPDAQMSTADDITN